MQFLYKFYITIQSKVKNRLKDKILLSIMICSDGTEVRPKKNKETLCDL